MRCVIALPHIDAGMIEWPINPRCVDDRRGALSCPKFITRCQDGGPHLPPREVSAVAVGSGAGAVVQAPVEDVPVDAIELPQLHGQTELGEAHEVVDHSAIGAAEIRPIPAEKARDQQLPVLHPDAARIVDVGHCGIAELMVQPVARERRGLQIGATQAAQLSVSSARQASADQPLTTSL